MGRPIAAQQPVRGHVQGSGVPPNEPGQSTTFYECMYVCIVHCKRWISMNESDRQRIGCTQSTVQSSTARPNSAVFAGYIADMPHAARRTQHAARSTQHAARYPRHTDRYVPYMRVCGHVISSTVMRSRCNAIQHRRVFWQGFSGRPAVP